MVVVFNNIYYLYAQVVRWKYPAWEAGCGTIRFRIVTLRGGISQMPNLSDNLNYRMMCDPIKSIATRLRGLREVLELSEQEVADSCGLSFLD